MAQTDRDAAAREAFMRALPVFQHARCTNCHIRADSPRQGNAARLHQPPVKRGADGRGEGATRCTACHKDANGAIPGAPDWHMPAPGRAGWDGLTPAEICAALKDPARNAGLTRDQLATHVANDPLVRWGFEPGGVRAKPPLSHADFVAQVRAWSDNGGECPN